MNNTGAYGYMGRYLAAIAARPEWLIGVEIRSRDPSKVTVLDYWA